ncbi:MULTISPECIES: hypothetical protein [Fictibacillus]|uniref:Uncharacterized protein n=1 Tax=Fictibacillus terranigra TaxID=3058424 RepID=A0ABT8E4I8_9BACL|nr:hypothetical protein [Fictibacillus sp. CENA-BCM004]MDN4072813.1 hypothetical protein [Fictibacillus sp. CENA-BCM004]
MMGLSLFIFFLLLFAFFIDWRRKKNNNQLNRSTHPGAKPGEDSNHLMGDNRYDGGGP